MKNVCRQGLRGFKYSICCQIEKSAHTADDEFGIHLRNLPVIFNEEWDYSPKLHKLYNPFCEPLAVKQEGFFKINGWFEYLSADAIVEIKVEEQKALGLILLVLFQRLFLGRSTFLSFALLRL